MILDFHISNQQLARKDHTYLVNLSKNYLQAHFTFHTTEWENLTKYVTFNAKKDNYRYRLTNDTVDVPNELLKHKYFYVKCYGIDEKDEDDGLVVTTNDVAVELDIVDNKPLMDAPTDTDIEEIFNRIGSLVHSKCDRVTLKGRKILCYVGGTPITVIPINDETIINILNEPYIEVDKSKLTTEGRLFYERHNL